MPRRKKTGQSPARVPGVPPEAGSLGHTAGYGPPQGFDGAMANNFPAGRDSIVQRMQEMFSHLDPEVIYIVLSECDFKGSAQRGSPVVKPAVGLPGVLFNQLAGNAVSSVFHGIFMYLFFYFLTTREALQWRSRVRSRYHPHRASSPVHAPSSTCCARLYERLRERQ